MPAAVLQPPSRQALVDSTNTRRNLSSPQSAGRKRRHDGSPISTSQARSKGFGSSQPGSSQPKSHFEAEVLEKFSQDISGLKKNNAEKDQHWPRPSLDDFKPRSDALCFQQVDAEEGSLHGGKTTVKLFGTTEVSWLPEHCSAATTNM